MGPEKSLNNWHGRRASKKLWEEGTLFHSFLRFPARLNENSPEDLLLIDRLLGILDKGLVAPAHCNDGSVVSDLNITVHGSSIDYDSVIFLHQYTKSDSLMYTLLGTGGDDDEKVMVIVDNDTPILSPEDMDAGWPVMSLDEVYATEPIDPSCFRALYLPRRYMAETAVRAALEPHDMPVFTY